MLVYLIFFYDHKQYISHDEILMLEKNTNFLPVNIHDWTVMFHGYGKGTTPENSHFEK